MPVGLNLAQLNRISDPHDPYDLDSAMAESIAVASATGAVKQPYAPPLPQRANSPSPEAQIARQGVIGGALFAPSSIPPISERILTSEERDISASARGRAGVVQFIPSRPGEKELIERRHRERRGR